MPSRLPCGHAMTLKPLILARRRQSGRGQEIGEVLSDRMGSHPAIPMSACASWGRPSVAEVPHGERVEPDLGRFRFNAVRRLDRRRLCRGRRPKVCTHLGNVPKCAEIPSPRWRGEGDGERLASASPRCVHTVGQRPRLQNSQPVLPRRLGSYRRPHNPSAVRLPRRRRALSLEGRHVTRSLSRRAEPL